MGTTEVIAGQRKASRLPYVRCYLVSGGTTYAFTTTGSIIGGVTDTINRVKSVYQRLDPYKEDFNVVLTNGDQALSALDLKGYQLTLGFGFIIDGTPDYIDQPPLWVIDQEFDSRPGKLTLTLNCKGTMSCINDDHANAEFTAGDTDEIKDLVEDILDATLSPYNHCTAYTLDWAGVTLATDVNLFKPAGNFQIYLNSNRLAMVRLLLDHTYAFMRPASDGSIDFIKPAQGAFNYEYELSGDHTFLIKEDSRRVTIPNYVVVYGGEYDENTDTWEFDGHASVASGYKEVRYYEAFSGIATDGECDAVAGAILSNFTLNRRMCVALVPMNCTAKLFDYVKITDVRQGDSATGNIGYIVRRFEAGKFQMEIGFGGWLDNRKVAQFVSTYRRTVKESITNWMTVSCPETYLLAGDSITFHVIPTIVGGADRLYVKAYSIYANGVDDIKIKITQGSSVKWSKEADVYMKLWTYTFVGLTDNGAFTFTIENENATLPAYVSAFLTYGLSTTTPG